MKNRTNMAIPSGLFVSVSGCKDLISVASVQDAIDHLWATANKTIPKYAMANVGKSGKWKDNAAMKGLIAPSENAKKILNRLNRQ